jgi:hypothetical protein
MVRIWGSAALEVDFCPLSRDREHPNKTTDSAMDAYQTEPVNRTKKKWKKKDLLIAFPGDVHRSFSQIEIAHAGRANGDDVKIDIAVNATYPLFSYLFGVFSVHGVASKLLEFFRRIVFAKDGCGSPYLEAGGCKKIFQGIERVGYSERDKGVVLDIHYLSTPL